MNQNARKLLIIEDDTIIANIYRSKLEKEGYQVEILTDGQAGFYRLHESHFDALLLDLMLPQMNGLDILKKIRAQQRFDKFPVFVFTNAYLGNIAQEAAQAGATHVFFKATSTPKQIIDAINNVLMGAAPSAPPVPTPSEPEPAPASGSTAILTGPPLGVQPAPKPAASAPQTPVNPFASPQPPSSPLAPPSAQPQPFGQPQTFSQPPPSRFGQPQTFGQPPPFSQPSLSPLVQPPASTPPSPFGPSGDGSATPSPFGQAPPFSQASAMTSRPSASPFGQASPFAPPVAGASPPPSPVAPPAAPFTPTPGFGYPVGTDSDFQGDILRIFQESAPESINALRKLLQSLIQGESQDAKQGMLSELQRKIHTINSNASMAGLQSIPQLGTAFEALLKELYVTPANLNASTLNTLAKTIDFLSVLLQKGTAADPSSPPQICILVVDDEVISRRAVTHAIQKVNLRSVNVEDPRVAFKLLEDNSFDLVITDVDMPGLNGFELCTKLRALPAHKNTPVIFVTGLTDFENRARSVLSGGNDLIAKPFLLIELAVKALTFVIKGRISQIKP